MAFDDLIICLFRTLPEPSNFNIVYTGITYGPIFRVTGELPNCRMNSLSLYCREKSEPPVTIDLSSIPVSAYRHFDILLYPDNVSKEELEGAGPDVRVTYPSNWKGGYIAMRNYLVPPGTRVVTPSVSSVGSTACTRLPEVLYAGNTGIKDHDLQKMRRVIALNCVTAAVMVTVFRCPVNVIVAIVGLGLLGLGAVYALLFAAGKRGLKKHFALVCRQRNELALPDAITASKVSQPSREHRYWVMHYDVSKGGDLLVTGRIKPTGQKYWSLVVYDVYGLPLAQYVNDVNVQFTNGTSQSEEEYTIAIRLTSQVPSYQYCYVPHDSSGKVSAGRVGFGYIDISGHPVGYAIFRLVHPVDDSVIVYSAPLVTTVSSLTERSLPRDKKCVESKKTT